jgi:hypothetical protein
MFGGKSRTFSSRDKRAVVLEESWFDPLVEFLEIVTEVRELGNPAATRRNWRVHGPDANGGYGGLQGLGGLEAVYCHGVAAVAGGSWSADFNHRLTKLGELTMCGCD